MGMSEKFRKTFQFNPERRTVLKLAAIAGVSAAADILLPETHEPLRSHSEHKPSTKIPADILQDEVLNAMHINIYQTDNTKLFLRPEALDFPLFQDVIQGKVSEVNIVLVDAPYMYWSNRNAIPAGPREVWEAANNPYDWLERSIESTKFGLQEYTKSLHEDTQSSTIDYYKKQIQNSEKYLSSLEQQLKQAEKEESDPNSATLLSGQYLSGSALNQSNPLFIRDHPDVKEKVYIFLAVGYNDWPDPKDSYPDPNWWNPIEKHSSDKNDYKYSRSGMVFPNTDTGFVLRHEISHHTPVDNQTAGKTSNSEHDADTGAIESIKKAWNKFKKNGDTSGYPFVFVNKNGVTITKTVSLQGKQSA